MSRVEVRDLRVRRGTRRVLDGISFTVEEGECIALLGTSGAGKSTALMAIAGLLPVEGGTITVAGRDVTHLPAEERNAVYLFQEPLLFPFRTAAGNVAFGLEMRGVPRAEREARVAAMLEQVQLGDLAHRRPDQLSGGQQQRVALARALVTTPDVLLLDEPFANLDVALRAGMQALLQTLCRALRVSTLLVTHDPVEAALLADRVGVLADGGLQALDTPRRLLAQARDTGAAGRALETLLGDTLLLAGHAEAGDFVGEEARLPLPPGASGADPHERLWAAIRLTRDLRPPDAAS